MIKVCVPATSANLGPGFDCMGLALDIWNEITYESAESLIYKAVGEGADKLNKGNRNLLTRAYFRVYEICGRKFEGVQISAHNEILMSSGLGSSAAAIVAGLFGANEMLGKPLPENELLKLAADIEGHPDNVAPAMFGGLVVSIMNAGEIVWRRFEIPQWTIVIVKPLVEWHTKTARAVLPRSVSRADAIFNIGRSTLVVEALRAGDLDLLQKSMDDRIHQPYRLKHIPGGMSAYKTAKRFGAAALSGAGPSIIAFVPQAQAQTAKEQIACVFEERGIETKSLITKPEKRGVYRIQE
jgi:homoserine kinase